MTLEDKLEEIKKELISLLEENKDIDDQLFMIYLERAYLNIISALNILVGDKK